MHSLTEIVKQRLRVDTEEDVLASRQGAGDSRIYLLMTKVADASEDGGGEEVYTGVHVREVEHNEERYVVVCLNETTKQVKVTRQIKERMVSQDKQK